MRMRCVVAVGLLALSLPIGCSCRRGGAVAVGRGSAVVVVDPDEVGRPDSDSEREPNNTAKQAQEIPRDRGVEGALSEGDRDWYRVTIVAPPAMVPAHALPPPAAPALGSPATPLPASRSAASAVAPSLPLPPVHVLSATLSGVAGADLVLEAWSEKLQRLVRIDNSGVGEGEVLVNLAVERGTVFLLVRESKGRAIGGRYRLTYALRPAEDSEEREPNWKAPLATPLALEGEAIGFLGWKTDTDWYRVGVTGIEPSTRLRVEYDGLDEVSAQLSVRSEKSVLQERWGAPGEAISLSNLAVTGGVNELFVVVRTQNSFNVESRYSVRVVSSVPPGLTEAEPNDRPAQATPVTLGTPVFGLLGDTRDRDLYVVKVTEPGVLRVETIPPLNLDVALAVVDDSGNVLWEVDSGPAREPEILPFVGVRPPHAIFQVRAPRSASVSPVAPYQIKASSPGQGSFEREPNGDLSAATTWSADAAQMLGTIHPKGDVDWYRVAVSADGSRLVARTSKLKLKLKLELFGADGSPRSAALADADGNVRLEVPTDVGDEVLLKVSEASGKQASPLEPYRLLREKP